MRQPKLNADNSPGQPVKGMLENTQVNGEW
jgi:hypothetical protein